MGPRLASTPALSRWAISGRVAPAGMGTRAGPPRSAAAAVPDAGAVLMPGWRAGGVDASATREQRYTSEQMATNPMTPAMIPKMAPGLMLLELSDKSLDS